MESALAEFGPAEAEALWVTHYASPGAAVRIPGEVDAIYRVDEADGERVLLRITDASAAALQCAVLRHIAGSDPRLPVPRMRETTAGEDIVLFQTAKGEDKAVFATSFLSGTAQARAAVPAAPTKVFGTLARLDRALAGLSHPGARRALLWDVSRADQIVPLLSAIGDHDLRARAERAIDNWRSLVVPALPGLRRQAIHNDFNPSNILVDDSGAIVGIIDFGDVIEAPLICDLATAIAYQEPQGALDRLIADAAADYAAVLPLTDDEIALLAPLARARAAMVAAITHWRAAKAPANRDYLLRNAPRAARILTAP